MKMKLKMILVILLAIIINSCTENFESINTNPNVPNDVPPNLLLPGIINNPLNTLVYESWEIGNIVIQHTAKNQFVNEDRYLWGERNSIWNTFYSNLRNVQNMLLKSETEQKKNYQAIALILRSWMFSVLTDCYGDIPYSQAIKAKTEGINFPVYDKQEDIYKGMLDDLKLASDLLGTSTEKVSGDILYKGDLTKWKKLANSLRIRMLMRISDRKSVAADLQAIVNNSNYPIMESNDDNGALTYLSAFPNQFPLHTTRVGSFNEYRISKTITDTLKSLNDPRLQIFARPTPATENTANPVIMGIPNGMDDVKALTYNGGQQNQSPVGRLFFEDAITAKGLKVARGVIMNYAELQFLLAEAANKGLISGDAKTYYENGIKASFQFYELEMPTGYLALPQVAYKGGTEGLEKIGFQKWISLFFQGLEAWFDWRRTNIPRLIPGESNLNGNKIPVRFIYPTIEQTLNSENLSKAIARQGADNINTRVWWDVQ